MKLNKKFLLYTFIFIMVSMLVTRTYNVTANTNKYYDYVISSYDINIVVNENNTFNITENIGANFIVSSHGIFRTIPLNNKITRLDKTTSRNRAKIKDIRVDSPFSTYMKDGSKVIKIGSSKETLTGPKDYKITYLYDIGKDPCKSYDELYFNIIGEDWDTSISNVTFTIVMPKAFDESLLGFSSGEKGSTNSSNISYDVVGNVITGKYIGFLRPGEAITVRMELPNGYFIGASNHIDLWSVLVIMMSLVFVIFAYLTWLKYGKDDQVVETVEFYPPNGFNSAEVGFMYKGNTSQTDVISLLIYLANQGYIKISESNLNTDSKDYTLIKMKDYNGNNSGEKMFFDGLFKSKDIVTATDLKDKFYVTLENVRSEINSKKNKNKIFKNKPKGKGFKIIIMIILTAIFISAKPVTQSSEAAVIIFAVLFPAFGFSIMFFLILGKLPIPIKIFGLLWGIGFGGVPWITLVLPGLLREPIYMVTYIVGVASITGMVLAVKYMPNRTPFGNEMLGKIRGLQTFLDTVEKPKLELCVMQDPEYFYNILPYTYVLGISDKWISKFEEISLQTPNWYEGRSTFEMRSFSKFMSVTMTSVSSVMSSSPSSSSGGSSSGGGSSGGGSGGGGGGSW